MQDLVGVLLDPKRTDSTRAPELKWLNAYTCGGSRMGPPILLNVGETWEHAPSGLIARLNAAPRAFHGYHLAHEGLPSLIDTAGAFARHSYELDDEQLPNERIAITSIGTRSVMFDFTRMVRDLTGIATAYVPSPGWDYSGVVRPLGFNALPYEINDASVPGTEVDPKPGDIVVINPQHNPTGLDVGQRWLESIVERTKAAQAWLLIDDAYHDLVDPDHCPSTAIRPVLNCGHERWLLVRSLGKHFCCNGWGLGFFVGPVSLVDLLVNTYRKAHAYCYHGMLQWAMSEWMMTTDATDHVAVYTGRIRSNKQIVERTLGAHGVPITPSPCTPYQLIPVPEGYERSEQGVRRFIRDCVLSTGVLLYRLIPTISPLSYRCVRINCGVEPAVLNNAIQRLVAWGYPRIAPSTEAIN